MDIRNGFLFATVFITGAAVLMLEVAAVRVLSPFYGSSLYVFSSVLTVILAALSFGYWYGGRRADQRQSIDDLYLLITMSGIVVLILLLVAQIVLPRYATGLSVQFGPLLFSLGLFFIPAFLLGMVSPYVIKLQSLVTPSEQIGSVVGKTFFWGTVGSILGSLGTGFVFIPKLGVQNTIILVSVMLIILGLFLPLLFGKKLKQAVASIVLIIFILFSGALYTFDTAKRQRYVHSSDGLYSSIKISDIPLGDRTVRLLNRDTNNSSAIYLDSTDHVFAYSQFLNLLPDLISEPKQFLLLGGGAYTMPTILHETHPDLQIDVVEIEPVLHELALTYFNLPDSPRIVNHPMDGRVFLSKNNAQRYDVIFMDAFGTDTAPPFHMVTEEYYAHVQEHLTDEGVLITNFIGTVRPYARPSLTGSFVKTLLATFPNTRAFGLNPNNPDELQNIIFISRNGDTPLPVGDNTITMRTGNTLPVANLEVDLNRYNLSRELLLTDDHAPVEYLMAKQR